MKARRFLIATVASLSLFAGSTAAANAASESTYPASGSWSCPSGQTVTLSVYYSNLSSMDAEFVYNISRARESRVALPTTGFDEETIVIQTGMQEASYYAYFPNDDGSFIDVSHGCSS